MTTSPHTNTTETPLEARLRADAPAWRAAGARDVDAAVRARTRVLAAVRGARPISDAPRLGAGTRWALAAAASLLAFLGLRAALDRGPEESGPRSPSRSGSAVAVGTGDAAAASSTDAHAEAERDAPRLEFLLTPLKAGTGGRGAALPFDAALLAESRALAMDASRVTSSMVGSLPDPLRRILSQ